MTSSQEMEWVYSYNTGARTGRMGQAYGLVLCSLPYLKGPWTVCSNSRHCWLGDGKGIRPVKKLDVGLLVVMIWQELCTTYSSSSPAVTTTSIVLCFNKTPANPGSPGKWPLKRKDRVTQQTLQGFEMSWWLVMRYGYYRETTWTGRTCNSFNVQLSFFLNAKQIGKIFYEDTSICHPLLHPKWKAGVSLRTYHNIGALTYWPE